MKTKKTIFILCLLVFLSIASVNASDIDDAAIQTNDASEDVIASDALNHQDMTGIADENDKLGSSFTDLQEYIDQAEEGDEIKLNSNHQFLDGERVISIAKNLTIDGDHYTLNGNNKEVIISISADNKNVILKNIIFEQGNSPYHGGAIYNVHSSSSIVLINCEFRNNNANEFGGAIYSEGKIDIINSTFESNTAKKDGGAVYSLTNLNAIDSTFKSNTAKNNGGAVYCKEQATIKGSDFEENHAENDGGAIKAVNKCQIDSTTFNNNVADGYGGAIYADYLTVTSQNGPNKFTNNKAKYQGGAIFAPHDAYLNWEDDGSAMTIMDSNTVTKQESTDACGGAIYAKENLYAKFLSFTDNFAFYYGGAVYSIGTAHIANSTFESNHVDGTNDYETQGGAVYGNGKLYIANSTFKSNYAGECGGAIYCKEENTISNSSFEDNHMFRDDSSSKNYNGGAIYSVGRCNIDSCSFDNNNAFTDGGAIYCEDETHITKSEFSANTAESDDRKSYGGAIRSKGKIYIDSSTFKNNHAQLHGGAICADSDLTITGKSEFNGNTAEMEEASLRDNDGGAIYCYRNAVIDNTLFKGNKALVDGGAIFCEGKTTVSNSKFENNKATSTNAERCFGGAIRSNGKVEIVNCSFDDNHADNWGGAIYADGEISIKDSSFEGNYAKNVAAVYAETVTKVSNSTFKKNKAPTNDGGAIYINSKCNPEFTSCTFEENTCPGSGGAIYVSSSDSHLTLSNCEFSDNSADTDGGAVYCAGQTTISNSKFKNNVATGNSYGGAIRSKGNALVENCEFDSNHAKNWGGAVYTDGELTIENSNFTGNKAKNAGAVYASKISQVSGSTFKKNNATSGHGGAVHIYHECSPEFTSCTFEENGCDNKGGAIYLDSSSSHLTVSKCTFTNNIVTIDGGAIYCEGQTTVSDSKFDNNTAFGTLFTENYGGAIRSVGKITVDNCEFYKNHAYNWGGAIYTDDEISITDCNFTENTALDAGAVYASKISHVSGSTFKKNKANSNHGGAVCIYNKCSPEFSSCTFEENTCYNKGGAIYLDSSSSHLRISNCTFTSNTAVVDGGAIYCEGQTTVTDSKFDYNTAKGASLAKCYGGAIRSVGTISVDNSEFFKNYADNWGGAIYTDDEISINDCNFTENNAKDAGAVYASKVIKVSNSTFNSNNADETGGAIYIYNKCTPEFTSCTFEDNVCYGNGGAVYLDSSSTKLTLFDCTFVGNSAQSDDESNGGAVYTKGDMSIISCNFTNNYAKTHGGAVYAGTISYATAESIFIKNNVDSGNGGAIFIDDNCDPKFVSCRFEENICHKHGGAIFLNSVHAHLNLTHCTFVGNDADESGEIVYNYGYFDSIDRCWFGTNDPDFDDQFREHHGLSSDEDHVPTDYLIIKIKVDSHDLYVGNTYNVTVYFQSTKESPIKEDILHSTGTFHGDGNFFNIDSDKNDMTSSVIFTKENARISGKLDHQTVYLDLDVKNKNTSEVKIISCEDVQYPHDLTVTYEITNMADKAFYTVKTDLGEITSEGELTNSSGTINVKYLSPGWYSITITNPEAWAVLSSNATATFRVFIPVSINITADNMTYGNPTTFTVKADRDGFYYVAIKGQVIEMNVTDGICVKQAMLNAGSYKTNTTSYYADLKLNCSEASFTVYKAANDACMSVGNVTYGTPSVIEVSASVDGNYTVDINGTPITISVENGYGNNTVSLNAGNYYANVTFDNDNYDTESKNTTFEVCKADTNITVVVLDVVYPKEVEGIVNSNADGKYNLTIGDYSAILDVINGSCEFNAGILSPGQYLINVSYPGDLNHNSNSYSVNVTVNKIPTKIVAPDISAVYNVDKNLTVTLIDANGNPIAYANVTVNLNGLQTFTTDENGQFNVSTKGLVPKTYLATITFENQGVYSESTADVKVVVKKATPKITAKVKKFKTTTKTKKYTITLKDNTGKAMKNVKVTLKVKGKTYAAKTNSKGNATFKITKLTKTGTFKATVTYKGSKYYNKVTKKAKITVVFKTVSKGSKDKATVKKIQRALKKNGFYLTAYGHYLMVDGIYHQQTVKGVKEFQKAKGLKVTGKVDEKTAKKLKII